MLNFLIIKNCDKFTLFKYLFYTSIRTVKNNNTSQFFRLSIFIVFSDRWRDCWNDPAREQLIFV